MRLELLKDVNEQYSTIEQILYNRGISPDEFYHYLNTTDADINDFSLLGLENLAAALGAILTAVNYNARAVIVIDCDCDGYCSAAILINFLYCLFPSWVEHRLDYYMHSGKQHGLEDCHDLFIDQYKLVILPDAGSNDYEYHKRLKENGINVVCLDHHLADKISEDAIIVNNQLSDYPNKEFCGAGVTWQFCRYIDSMINTNFADQFIDLVALANIGDMMSLHSIETKHLITKGLKRENIHNPFIHYMLEKNDFPLSKLDYASADPDQACTGIGAAFFIVPFVNATTRTGTIEEKNLIFESMLQHKAFIKIPEIKRGKETGRTENLVLQAVRTIGNIKNRQTRLEDNAMAFLHEKINRENLLDHKILVFLLESKEVEGTIRGLVANKFMAKYQRPCMVLTKTDHKTYEGSMRGYTKNGLVDFKEALEQCKGVDWVQGHNNAAGCCLEADKINDFIESSDEILSQYPNDPMYRVDYLFERNLTPKDKQHILDISHLNDLWGQDFDRAYVGIKDVTITKDNIHLLSEDKNPTLKITLPCGVDIMKFKSSREEYESLLPKENGSIKIDVVGKCAVNVWNGTTTPQIITEDYQKTSETSYYF